MNGISGRLNKVLGGHKRARHISTLPRPAAGNGPEPPKDLPNPEALRSTESDLTATLPAGTARLIVTQDYSGETECYRLTGTCCCGIDLMPIGPQPRPTELSLGSLFSPEREGKSPAEIYLLFKSWAVNLNERLHTWFSRLRQAHGESLRLVILDITDFDLPWEMLWVGRRPDSNLPAGWLGALVTVIRSTTALERRQSSPERTSAMACRGSVAAFIHEDMRRDRMLFENLSARIWHESLDDLFWHLDQPGDPIALVYIACHGGYPAARAGVKASGAKIYLIDNAVNGDYVTVRDIDSRPFERISASRSIVFLNACHSARRGFDHELNDGILRGFAEVFLRVGAAGFVGTMGAVGLQAGHKTACELLAYLQQNKGVPIAIALREFRQRIAAAAPTPTRSTDDTASRALFPLFYAFMYVYYGGPDTTLDLLPGGGGV